MLTVKTSSLFTPGRQLLDDGVVLRLRERRSVVVGVAHHHPQLHRLGDLSAIWTLHHNADQKLSTQQAEEWQVDGWMDDG